MRPVQLPTQPVPALSDTEVLFRLLPLNIDQCEQRCDLSPMLYVWLGLHLHAARYAMMSRADICVYQQHFIH